MWYEQGRVTYRWLFEHKSDFGRSSRLCFWVGHSPKLKSGRVAAVAMIRPKDLRKIFQMENGCFETVGCVSDGPVPA